jgi:biotin carboxyl carrier protein
MNRRVTHCGHAGREVCAPAAGIFHAGPPANPTAEGEVVTEGAPLGVIETLDGPQAIVSPHSGFLYRVRESQSLVAPGEWIAVIR